MHVAGFGFHSLAPAPSSRGDVTLVRGRGNALASGGGFFTYTYTFLPSPTKQEFGAEHPAPRQQARPVQQSSVSVVDPKASRSGERDGWAGGPAAGAPMLYVYVRMYVCINVLFTAGFFSHGAQ